MYAIDWLGLLLSAFLAAESISSSMMTRPGSAFSAWSRRVSSGSLFGVVGFGVVGVGLGLGFGLVLLPTFGVVGFGVTGAVGSVTGGVGVGVFTPGTPDRRRVGLACRRGPQCRPYPPCRPCPPYP